MVKITVSESNSKNLNVAYIYNSMTRYLSICGADADITFDDSRTNLVMTAENRFHSYLRKFTEERVAESVAIGYKYALFQKNIRPSGLSETDREVLLCALVSADFDEDKRYVAERLKDIRVYSIDGFFNFRLQALKEKWTGIIDCIPCCFTERDLKDFLDYILSEREPSIVHFKDGELYDADYVRLKCAALIDGGLDDFSIVREVLLSGATEVECLTNPPPVLCDVLKKYFGSRTAFRFS